MCALTQCTMSVYSIKYRTEDGSLELKHVANCVLITIYELCLTEQIYQNVFCFARSQYPEGPATGHRDTGFSWFPRVYKRMLRWFPSFKVATTCYSCRLPDLNFLVTFFFFFIFVYM